MGHHKPSFKVGKPRPNSVMNPAVIKFQVVWQQGQGWFLFWVSLF